MLRVGAALQADVGLGVRDVGEVAEPQRDVAVGVEGASSLGGVLAAGAAGRSEQGATGEDEERSTSKS